MSRQQRRQYRRLRKQLAQAVGLRQIEETFTTTVAGMVRTLGLAADELEAGLLDPGMPGRSDFIREVRELQAHFSRDSASALQGLLSAYEDPARTKRALAFSGQESESEAQSDPAQDKQSCARDFQGGGRP